MDGIPSCGKKILVIKANWYLLTLNQNRTHSVTVCFNKHILKSVLKNWSVFPVAGCNPVVILSRVADKWFDSITLHQIISRWTSGLGQQVFNLRRRVRSPYAIPNLAL